MTSPETRGDDVAREIKRTLRGLVLATSVLFLLLIGNAVWTRSVASSSNDALCSLRADLQRRVTASRTFLAEHPAGFAGVSPKVIQDGIDNQQRTIVALSRLNCD